MGRLVAVALLICCGFVLCEAQLSEQKETTFPLCPAGARPLKRKNGEPRKCLPHQNHLCLSGLGSNTDAKTVCCWNNHVDYFCCLDVTAAQCPTYHNVTVVINNAYPHDPNAPREFHFREGIENDLSPAILRGVGGASSNRKDDKDEENFEVRQRGRR
uniref:Uncharacterized protein n=1 Tax=Plectus sambesii TaxID=2011161 RepID=A0A914W6R3_9BILA